MHSGGACSLSYLKATPLSEGERKSRGEAKGTGDQFPCMHSKRVHQVTLLGVTDPAQLLVLVSKTLAQQAATDE